MSSGHSPRGGFGHSPRGELPRGEFSRREPPRARRYERPDREQPIETAEEKAKEDAMLEEKMKAIRKKNEELIKRQQEIEEDRRNADRLSDQLVKKKSPETKMAGVATDRSGEPKGMGRARGRVLAKLSRERLKASEWEEKRRKNIERVEEEQRKVAEPSTGGSNFLHDDRRVDMSKVTGRTERSWGGSNFNNVRSQMERDKGRQPRGETNPEIHMTGKERREYLEWKEERKRIDEDRKERAKRSGDWSREWDKTKVYDSKSKAWVDQEGGDAFDWSYQRQDRRREPARLGEWMPHQDDRNSSSRNFRSRRAESWEDEEQEDGRMRRRGDKGGSSSSDDWKESSRGNELKGNQTRFRGASSSSSHHHREQHQPSEDWGESCGDEPSLQTQTQSVHHKRQNQPTSSVAPSTEDWGGNVGMETEDSKVDRKREHETASRHRNEKMHNVSSTTEDWGAEISEKPTKESNVDEKNTATSHAEHGTESENTKHTQAENSSMTTAKQETATCGQKTLVDSREHVENLTVSTLSDGGRRVVVSPEKEGTVTAESKEQRTPRHNRRKLQQKDKEDSEQKGRDKDDAQFVDADDEISSLTHGENLPCPQTSSKTVETGGSPANMPTPDTTTESYSAASTSMLQTDNTVTATTSEVSRHSNVDTSAVPPTTETAQQVGKDTRQVSLEEAPRHVKKHPEPLKVSMGRRSSQEETGAKEGPVPTTPDFLKPSYTDPNPKIDWGEYMEEIAEESA